jgi:hypothetical protein
MSFDTNEAGEYIAVRQRDQILVAPGLEGVAILKQVSPLDDRPSVIFVEREDIPKLIKLLRLIHKGELE